MAHHDLKCVQPFFDAVIEGRKRFEIRKNDRNFQEGDTVTLREYAPPELTGRETSWQIGYVTNFEQQRGYVVFSLLPLGRNPC